MVLSHMQALGPREIMIYIVLQLIVFGEAPQIGILHLDEVIGLNNNKIISFTSTTR